jgi:septum formation protein
MFILGSASPRRCELLRQLGLDFAVEASDVGEERLEGESAEGLAARLARAKADHVARRNSTAWVLGADTVVVYAAEILGKPPSRSEARRMLRTLSGRSHRVLTAVTLFGPGAQHRESLLVQSVVTFRALAEAEIEDYLDTGESFDKAGGYGVQGTAGGFIERVMGSYTNVVGLPLDEVRALLQRHGLIGATS